MRLLIANPWYLTNHRDIGTVFTLSGIFFTLFAALSFFQCPQFIFNAWTADAPVRWQIMFQDPGTKSMTNIQELHNDLMFFIVAISVFVLYILLRVVTAFRIENKATIRRLSLQHHTSLEVIWTLIPAVILMFLALPSYTLLYHLDEILSPRVTLKVLGHQWYWHYEYPDLTKEGFENEGISFDSYMLPADDLEPVGALRLLDVDNRVVLPIDTSVRALISSSDVIHSWAIPSLGVKVDACPGRLNQVGFNINRAGVFYGQCSEICGVNHSFMPIAIEACRLENFVSWLSDVLESVFMGGNWFNKWGNKKNINEDHINKKEELSEEKPATPRVARQTNDRQPVVKVFENHIEDYPTALNLNYSWSFGSVLGLIFVYQILTGVVAAMHYAPNTLIAFNCLQHLDADVRLGFLMRYMHANGASMIFIAMYLHMGKAIYYRSYTNWKRFGLYLTGLLVFILMMAVGFLGYTLPWGQMSFWGATVITSLVTAIPSIGPYVGEVVWGGYSVDNATLDRFYSIHYVTPLLIVGLLYLHLVFLHYAKSSNPSGVVARRARIKFLVFFSWKDIALFILFVSGFETLCYYYPDVLGHSDNLIEANSMVTPSHIVPEWYFLPFYAVLRAVPNKALGVLAMFAAIAVVGVFSFIDTRVQRTNGFVWAFRIGFVLLVGDFVALAYIGSQPAEQPYVLGSQIAAGFWFFFFLIYMPMLCFADAWFFGRSLRYYKALMLAALWRETYAEYLEKKRRIEEFFDKKIKDERRNIKP